MKKRALAFLSASLSCALVVGLPASASETLSFSYGPLIRSLKISSLKTFADGGVVPDDLAFFLQFTTPEQQERLRTVLVKQAKLDPLLVSRFFYSGIGESVLKRLGNGITLSSGGNGMYALRSAMIGAAFSKEGLSLLSVFQQLPTGVRIQGEKIQAGAKVGKKIIVATDTLTKLLRSLTAKEAATDSNFNYANLPDPRKPGPFKVEEAVWNLNDKTRDRKFYVNVYRPVGDSQQKIHVVVFSHGLFSRPEAYAEGLRQLASYGFVVAAPQHPGSDSIRLKETLRGLHKDLFDINDFINRPKDLSFVLDELNRRNASDYGGRLDLASVGVFGHSFGGYTALALSGATIDFDYLQKSCDKETGGLVPSLLLECRALLLPRKAYQLQDPRAGAVFAANPVNRSIFGPVGLSRIAIPVLLASGSYDPAAPAALEQASSFTWLKSPQKYWMMAEGQAHVNFSQIDPGIKEAIESVGTLTIPSQNLIGSYISGTAVPFFTAYVQKSDTFKPHLRSAYAEYLSKGQTFKLDFITGSSSPELVTAIDTFRRANP
ncbi:alpha/beta hydrolase [Cyanobium sp. ATX 6F1]|uniref:alpha/beta hydrolase n=1 Tax=unclassified Cyanobium TaxID=2627006 RepID=UPI0020CC0459|nr:alpha/beta hydrolase [Cyanobium sp. ATX 6F1]MCP9915638.1 alpha/beta hydrolase [Cyanobium sp. ATX 6F1]